MKPDLPEAIAVTWDEDMIGYTIAVLKDSEIDRIAEAVANTPKRIQRAISIALNALESGNPGIAYNALSAVER